MRDSQDPSKPLKTPCKLPKDRPSQSPLRQKVFCLRQHDGGLGGDRCHHHLGTDLVSGDRRSAATWRRSWWCRWICGETFLLRVFLMFFVLWGCSFGGEVMCRCSCFWVLLVFWCVTNGSIRRPFKTSCLLLVLLVSANLFNTIKRMIGGPEAYNLRWASLKTHLANNQNETGPFGDDNLTSVSVSVSCCCGGCCCCCCRRRWGSISFYTRFWTFSFFPAALVVANLEMAEPIWGNGKRFGTRDLWRSFQSSASCPLERGDIGDVDGQCNQLAARAKLELNHTTFWWPK